MAFSMRPPPPLRELELPFVPQAGIRLVSLVITNQERGRTGKNQGCVVNSWYLMVVGRVRRSNQDQGSSYSLYRLLLSLRKESSSFFISCETLNPQIPLIVVPLNNRSERLPRRRNSGRIIQ